MPATTAIAVGTYTLETARSTIGLSHKTDRYQRTGDGWKFTERVYEIRYLDNTALAGSAPHAAHERMRES